MYTGKSVSVWRMGAPSSVYNKSDTYPPSKNETMARFNRVLIWVLLTVSVTMAQNKQQPNNRDYLRMRWVNVASRMPAEWYVSEDAKRVAENVLISQKEIGGWTKNQPYHHHFSDSLKAYYLQTKTEKGGTFDNGATITELRFLAKVYAHFKDKRYKQAFERGLNYIYISQYQNGGWPQFYPARVTTDEMLTDRTTPYSMHITYNDNAMMNIMQFLKEIATDNESFVSLSLDETTKDKAQQAFQQGVNGIKKNSLAEISQERRAGYSCYTDGPAEILLQYPSWLKKVNLTACSATDKNTFVPDMTNLFTVRIETHPGK